MQYVRFDFDFMVVKPFLFEKKFPVKTEARPHQERSLFQVCMC